MKNLLLSMSLIATINLHAGGFPWPLVQYDHAKIFLFNLGLEKESEFSWQVYEKGVYAESKKGEGVLIPQDKLDNMHSAMARGVNELLLGLSKCYLPRHGIIYYDKEGKPVASFSICFECDKIAFWDNENGSIKPKESQKFDIDKADKQLSSWKKIIKSLDVPVYDKRDEYAAHLAEDKRYEDLGVMYMQLDEKDSTFLKRYGVEDVQKWQVMIFHSKKLIQSTQTKISAGGEEWTYLQLSTKKSRFIFSFDETNPFLVEAIIRNDNILLPNGVSVGMSLDDVMATFPVYDGIAYPEQIQLKNEKVTIDYFFDKRTLVKIELKLSIE
jgi:hypothetical protein